MSISSNSYNFENTILEQFIVDAFERIGILPDLITAEQIQSAQRSGNLLLSEWISKGLNLWSTNQEMIGLTEHVSAYQLPIPTSQAIEVSLRTSTRQVSNQNGAVAFAFVPPPPLNPTTVIGAGVAANAFDGNPATSCTQTVPNGVIGYNYGILPAPSSLPVQIHLSLIGVQSNTDQNYTLVFENSNDGTNWTVQQSLVVPYGFPPSSAPLFPAGQITWFKLLNTNKFQYFRIRETGGSTLDIQELYFNNTLQDTILGRISRSEYMSYPQKDQVGRPSSYWLDRQINPVIYLWPVPNSQYKTLLFTRIRMLEDIGSFLNLVEVPQRFYEPLIAGMAYKLAVKYAPERISTLKTLYDEAFSTAASEDSEIVPLRVEASYIREWVL